MYEESNETMKRKIYCYTILITAITPMGNHRDNMRVFKNFTCLHLNKIIRLRFKDENYYILTDFMELFYFMKHI